MRNSATSPLVAALSLSLLLTSACTQGRNRGDREDGEERSPTAPSGVGTPAPAPAPTPTPTTPTPAPGAGTTGLTYAKDIQPILATDCVVCHSPSRASAGVDLSSYTAVMRVVTPGSARSILVQVTQPSGLMYNQLSGNRAQKAQTIYDWVVSNNAAQ